MWKHLQESKKPEESSGLPMRRYYVVEIWLAGHAFIDILALIAYSVSQLGPSNGFGAREKNFIGYFSTTMFAYHVAFYPIVYVLVRDLKFHDQIKQMNNTPSSSAKEVVIKIIKKTKAKLLSNTSSQRPLAKDAQTPISPTVSRWTEEQL